MEQGNDKDDAYRKWAKLKPINTQHPYARDPIQYWLRQASEFPRLSKMALDILTIPILNIDY